MGSMRDRVHAAIFRQPVVSKYSDGAHLSR